MAGWQLATALVVVAVAVAVPAVPAQAHTRTQETTNVESRITHDPMPDGVAFTVLTGGLLVEVENRTEAELIIHGYEGEPYLRIGPDGVAHNRRSPATYLNRERYRRVAMPPDVDPSAAAEWVTIRDRPAYVFHDHRTHWMSPVAPAFVDPGPLTELLMGTELVGPIGRAGDAAGVFQTWTIPVTYDGTTRTVQGELIWRDPPSAWPWWLLAGLLVAPAWLGWRARRDTDLDELIRPAALVVAGVAIINGIHLVDDLIAWPSDPLDELSGLLHTSLFLVGGIGGALWARFGTSGRLLALGIGSGCVLYHQGLIHLPLLFASSFPTVWPDGFVRLTVALGLLQAIPVATLTFARIRLTT